MNLNKSVHVGSLTIANNLPFTLIAGPCQIESKDHALETAHQLKEICAKQQIGLIYKSSFDKANRTSIQKQRGLGITKGLAVLNEVKTQLGLPILTDVHSAEQCSEVALVADILQIPAFLCRQTDLLIAAAKTNRVINVKKGQFLAPWDMRNVADKIASSGNDQILLCDRGTSFGYNTLISDMRGLPIMAQTGYPVVFDATHSVQQPGGMGDSSGGQREFVGYLAKAAMAVGIAALFIETHQDPDNAPSDGPNMIKLCDVPALLNKLNQIDKITKAP
ncbi:3-deoxy-8-phosphooctulonate synthase [Commensalibacter papalotli (ex Botero et al. 2024)]|uniref:2-dehydro-3-deoxyphosphooctonate aldolase n=1 Tax=Commensalibacter papalotli (ex Botero et al. 2024) TaxID=2972766 RepID=A0ABN8W4J6_9PROT|nr:3-deoxy-8-phosphooctulonate synthase [Commensalibacter papalotli (ex Botero et al. 2024)]CAI3924526.1 3-deoxy-D-manno-octulosonic acid (KDO) 8-phosphate synthase (KdsA) (PDB:1G7U) [Commensalibacter papalotli (ex Botero et al. 2024)]CAI3927568.1 3-deoxy-D-manno-octulosonic acid (KDO) 8-phosphate synthase (KdsA) (PDB:1G7U) [Commensalibacter papalotli (ex Botero et al. 2024)]